MCHLANLQQKTFSIGLSIQLDPVTNQPPFGRNREAATASCGLKSTEEDKEGTLLQLAAAATEVSVHVAVVCIKNKARQLSLKTFFCFTN